jgi:tetratricopeptide (TPR) repeat protein
MRVLGYLIDGTALWITLTALIYGYKLSRFKRSESKQKALGEIFNKSIRNSAFIALAVTTIGVTLKVWYDDQDKRVAHTTAKELIAFYESNRTELKSDAVPPPYVQGRLDRLEKYTKMGIALDDPEVFFAEGLGHLKKQEYKEAAEELAAAVGLRPDYAKAHERLSVCYERAGYYQLALEHGERARDLAGDDITLKVDALNIIGLAHPHLKDSDRKHHNDAALEAFGEALKLCEGRDTHNEAIIRENLGNLYRRLGNLSESKKQLDRSFSLFDSESDSDKSGILETIGAYYYIGEKNFVLAMDYYEKSLEVANDKNNPISKIAALNGIGNIYYDRARGSDKKSSTDEFNKLVDKAETNFERILEIAQIDTLRDDKAGAYLNIGNVHSKLKKDFRGALPFYFVALEIFREMKGLGETTKDPFVDDEINTLNNMTEAFARLEEYDNAIKYTLMILDLDIKNPAGHYNLACWYSLRGSVNDAIDWLMKGRKYFSPDLVTGSWNDDDLKNARSDTRFKDIMKVP